MNEDLALLTTLADAVERIVADTPPEAWGEEVGMGASGAPAQRIDVLAEGAILEVFASSGITLNVCTEEGGFTDHGAERTLIIDPVDGTLNAVRGIPFYCTSLAIARTGLADVEVGLVRNLPTGETYTVARGEGAWRDGTRLATRPYDPDNAVRSPLPRAGVGTGLSDLVDQARYVRSMGAAALELALVAQGALDVFVNMTSGLRIVDVAAATLMVREAGGIVVTPEGVEPDMGFDVARRIHLVAAGDRAALQRLGVVA